VLLRGEIRQDRRDRNRGGGDELRPTAYRDFELLVQQTEKFDIARGPQRSIIRGLQGL
jgi:hypothetical protein